MASQPAIPQSRLQSRRRSGLLGRTASRRLLIEQLGSRVLLAADLGMRSEIGIDSQEVGLLKPIADMMSNRSSGNSRQLDLDKTNARPNQQTNLINHADEWLFGWEHTIDFQQPYGPTIFTTITPSPWIDDAFAVKFTQSLSSHDALLHLGVAKEPSLIYPLIEREFSKRLIPNDPLFPNQWHLLNTGSFSGSVAGEDAKVTGVWDNFRGSGVVVAIVDDGLQYTHPDLAANYRADLSFDFNGNDNDPAPGPFDDHGTPVAGVVAAVQNNNLGVSGAAPLAQLSGIRLIAGGVTDTMEAAALTLHGNDIHIYNNSWGPFDIGTLNPGAQPGPQVRAALESAAVNGRNGLGSIYVWAGGNGLDNNDDVNYDMYANSRHTIAVGAITNAGTQAWYSESGAPLLVVAHSNGGTRGITTTALVGSASGDYTNSFGGTSSAAPLVSGVVALILDANPNLTSRDVQHVLANSARRNDPADNDWMQNGAGLWVNHKYGFGAVDAAAAVDLAQTWTTVGSELSSDSGNVTFNLPIPDNNPNGVEGTISITDSFQLEYVELQLETTHTDAGDLEVVLISPSGTPSVMAQTRSETANFTFAHTFTSARNWGENSSGNWTLRVIDKVSGNTGTLVRAQLKAYGYSTDTPLPDLSVSSLAVNEAAGSANFIVSIPEAATELISFDVTTVAMSATENEDYVPLNSQTYQIPIGATQVSVSVSIINDSIEELAETFRLQFTNVVNADAPRSQAVGTIIDDDDPEFYTAEPLAFLQPNAHLLAHSIANTVLLSKANDVDDLQIDLPANMPVFAVATPENPNGLVTIEWLDSAGNPTGVTFTSPAAGMPATTDMYLPGSNGLYGLRIRGDFVGGVNVDMKAGFIIEDGLADGSMAIDASLSGFGSFAVLGSVSGKAIVHTFDSASKFVDISSTGTPLNLGDDATVTITTTIGNAIIPAGSVTIGNNGGIIAGSNQNLFYIPESLPTGDFEAGVLPLWTDLFTGGQVYWQERTIEGQNALIVQWHEKNHFWVPNGSVTFQLQMFADNAMPLRFVYTDVIFGDQADDAGASAVIGYQASPADFAQFSAFAPSLTNESVISFVNVDEDVYTLDLSGHVGQHLDIVLAGLEGANYADAVLELLDPNGNVVAVGSPDPTGFNALNFDLAITNYAVVAGGVYSIRVAELTEPGEYLLSVQPQRHETESNNALTDTLRSLPVGQSHIGWLDAVTAGGDVRDHVILNLAAGQRVQISTATPMNSAAGMNANTLNPAIAVLDANGNVLASDSDSESDGINGKLFFSAPTAGSYVVRVDAESGAGVYLLNTVDTPVVIHGVEGIVVGDGTGQRSRVEQLVITFETEVTIEDGAFAVTRRGTGGGAVDVGFTSAVNGNGQTVATLTFGGAFATQGRLVDGNYELQIIASKIVDQSGSELDGDGDGAAGGNKVFGADAADRFFRFFGDVNGDRIINFTDFIAFRSAFGSNSSSQNYNEIFDVDDNGLIGFPDFIQFRSNFGNNLPFA